MMKFVYKNDKGLAILNEKVEILELASIGEFMKEINLVNEKIGRFEQNTQRYFNEPDYKTKRNYRNELKINHGEVFTLKEGVFVLDEEDAFIPIEEYQSFENPNSWTDDEKVGFAEILHLWIIDNDLTSDLYNFLRDINTKRSEYEIMMPDKYTKKFERLFHEELEKNDMVEFYEHHYQERLRQFKEYKENKDRQPVKVAVNTGVTH